MAEVQGVSGSPVVQRRLDDAKKTEADRQTNADAANNDVVRTEQRQEAESGNSVRVQRQQEEQATQSQQERAVDLTTPPPVSPALQAAERAAESQRQVERARNVKAEQNQPVAEKEIGGTINVTT
jgi:hypothetical protein